MDIKELKPRKQSRYSQGYVNPKTCKKLIDPSKPVIYRSSYEKKFMIWLESSRKVERWGSECIRIPYLFVDGKIHSYFPDYYVEFVDGTKMLVEIKPANQTRPPVNENCWAAKEWTRNSCKWRAAQEFCASKGIQFKILTENTISKL
jgi:hypothetical protein